MKKIWISVLALMLAAALWGCSRGGYTLVNVPKEMTIDVNTLSENAENLLPSGESTPLLAALPDEGLYIYATDAKVASGVLVKYDGVLQFFSWRFTPQLAKPKLFVADYNGDGKKDVAVTYISSSGQTLLRENLHVLLREDKGFKDNLYTAQKAAIEAGNHLLIESPQKDMFAAFLDGKRHAFSLKGHGEYVGTYFDDWQEFTLGETITVTLKPKLVFRDEQFPADSGMTYTAQIVFNNGIMTQTDAQISF